MQAILIIVCIFTMSIQNVLKKQYSIKCASGEYTFSLLTSFFAMIFFLFTSKGLVLNFEIFKYSFAFAICYALATIGALFAIKLGSLTLTSLFLSYSLIIPTLNGLIFLGDKITVYKIVGILALIISIFLVREEEKGEKKVSFKWLVYVLITFFANGFCSVIQNAQRLKFNGEHDSNFMVFSLIMVVLIFIVATIISEGKVLKENLKKGLILGALNGISNGMTNLLVMVSLAFVASSVFFPLLSAGGLVFTFACSVIFYKEKFIPRQLVGLGFGIVSLVLLNL